MKKILYFILEQWADWELAYISSAVNMLGKGKFENKTVSLIKDAVISIGGIKCSPDYDLQNVPQTVRQLLNLQKKFYRLYLLQRMSRLKSGMIFISLVFIARHCQECNFKF